MFPPVVGGWSIEYNHCRPLACRKRRLNEGLAGLYVADQWVGLPFDGRAPDAMEHSGTLVWNVDDGTLSIGVPCTPPGFLGCGVLRGPKHALNPCRHRLCHDCSGPGLVYILAVAF